MDKYQNKYRIPSARAPFWDYGRNAAYFVTICTQHRKYFFGDVVHGEMVMSEIGKIARDCWMEIPNHFPFVKLDGFVVMPNHVHGIIVIDKMDDGDHNRTDAINRVSTDTYNSNDHNRTDAINRASTDTYNSNDHNRTDAINRVSTIEKSIGGVTGNHNPMLHENLSRIIRWFKGRTSFESRKISADFAWQPRFHDHIIRNEKSYQTISEYIINNPLQWKNDTFFVQ
jgi:putative transposase